MRLQLLAGALALAGSSNAFSDSSPLVLLSTSAFDNAPDATQIQTSSQALRNVKDLLRACPTDHYLVVTQPGVTASDLSGAAGCSMPHLCRTAEDSNVKGRYILSEVAGELGASEIVDFINLACEASQKEVKVLELSLGTLSRDDRAGTLAENDEILKGGLDAISAEGSYTILFHSTPGEPDYEPSFAEPSYMDFDLRRRGQGGVMRRQSNETDWNKLPLFEKYQFFTPGIFMGLIVAILLFSILGVGLRALSSLEVSYGAFDKENGPSAQKKQQ